MRGLYREPLLYQEIPETDFFQTLMSHFFNSRPHSHRPVESAGAHQTEFACVRQIMEDGDESGKTARTACMYGNTELLWVWRWNVIQQSHSCTGAKYFGAGDPRDQRSKRRLAST